MSDSYPRDLIGYGRTPPDPKWPDGAKLAVQFVVNYEEGGESNILARRRGIRSVPLGDRRRAALAAPAPPEHGVDLRIWLPRRLLAPVAPVHRAARSAVTVYGVTLALARNPEAVEAMKEADWEIASHGLQVDRVQGLHRGRGAPPPHGGDPPPYRGHRHPPARLLSGPPSLNTIRILMEEGGFLYSSDSYADDLPYWVAGPHGPHLIVPYTLDANDMRFATPQGFNSGDQFFTYLKDSFDQLYAEGEAGAPKMMSVGLHCRLVGRPGRAAALARFLDYVQGHDDVWLARRIDIAWHWHAHHKPARK